jgi:hypothetical protein
MHQAIATEVCVTEHGLVIVGHYGTGTNIWYGIVGESHLSQYKMEFEPPKQSPATLLPDGRLLVVGRDSVCMTVHKSGTVRQASIPGQPIISGLSDDGVAYGGGPCFFRFENEQWNAAFAEVRRPESNSFDEDSILNEAVSFESVTCVGKTIAFGNRASCWVLNKNVWQKSDATFVRRMACAHGSWAAGSRVVLKYDDDANTFHAFEVTDDVSAIAGFRDYAVICMNGNLFNHLGLRLNGPSGVRSISAHESRLVCVAGGAVFETHDFLSWKQIDLS